MCLILPVLLLSGCAPSYRIENQAHAVSMGIDYADGKMTVIVQVPNLGAPAPKAGESNSSSYQIYSAEGENFETALSILQAMLPQQLNLTHLKSVVFSKDFAESAAFYPTIETFMNVFLVTGSAEVIVTEGKAGTLIENQKPHIGIRLSITIPSMLSFHSENGYIPSCTLSGLYAGLKGRYSTAMCALADTADGEKDEGDLKSAMPGEISYEGDNKNEYMGAALFDRHALKGTLSGLEMQACYLLTGRANRITDFASPYAMRVSTRKKRDVEIDIEKDPVKIKVILYLDVATIEKNTDLLAIQNYLKSEFEGVISKCQSLSVEPFGFAEEAARKFKTNDSFEKFNWLSKFSTADVEVSLILDGEK